MNTIITTLNNIGVHFWQFAIEMFIQSTILIVLLFAVDFFLRKRVRAVFRYFLWLLVLAKLLLIINVASPVGIETWLNKLRPEKIEKNYTILNQNFTYEPKTISQVSEPATKTFSVVSTENVLPTVQTHLNKLPPLNWQGYLFLSWCIGILIFVVLLIQRLLFIKGLISQTKNATPELQNLFEESLKTMKLNGEKIKLKISSNMVSPAVCGLFRPSILLPDYLINKLNQQQLRAVLLHELSHIKRCDLPINLLQTVLQIIYFYNPFVWFANNIIRKVREQAVDEAVLVALGNKATEYSSTLIDIAEMAFFRPALGLRLIGVVESKKALLQRIKHIINRPIPKTAKLSFTGVLSLIIIAMLVLPMAKAEEKAEEKAKEPTSLTKILRTPNSWNRIKNLEEWKQKPTQNEFKILNELVETNDWMLQHTATKILRRWGQITNTTLPEIENAEKIFEKMWCGKTSNDRYDKLIPGIVSLGNNIIPLLIDMLEYNQYDDRLRKRIAIKSLSLLKDKRIIPALKKAVTHEKHNSNNFIAQELYALLTYDQSDEMVEYVANIIASKTYQQNQIIVYLTRQNLSQQMKICSYYKTYNRSGKYGVIKSLGNIDDKDAFEMLSRIILEFPDRNGNFTYATRVLGEMQSGNACPLFLDLVKKSPTLNSDNMIFILGKKQYQPAIPTLEKIIANTENKRSKILAAGALCRLGIDYEKHAAIVREGLDKKMQSYTAYRVVGWLNDDKTAKLVATQLGSTKPEERTGALAIEALGKMGNDSVLTELKNSLVKVPVQNFEDVGKAIIAIGQSNNNEAIISDGQEIENLGKYLQRIKMSCQKVQIGINPRLKQNKENLFYVFDHYCPVKISTFII